MNKFLKYTTIAFLLVSCSKPSDKIRRIILYNDSVGYWNYEWPRDRAEFYGMTFEFDAKGKVKQYSYSKVKNKRWLFSDYGIEPRLE